jgi:predicted secreted protein
MAIVNDPEPPLNVRSAPTNEKANVVDQLENGTFLSVIKEQNGWLQITEPTKGWVAKSRTSHGCNQKVERVNFGKGEQASRITDRFIGTGSHQYLFQAREGQSMTITVQDGPFPLVTGPNGQTLVAGPDDQRRQWTGVLPATGDYTVQLDSNFRGYPYGFTVEIR